MKGFNLKLLFSIDDDFNVSLDASYGLRLCMRVDQKPFRILKIMINEHSDIWTAEEFLLAFAEIKHINQGS